MSSRTERARIYGTTSFDVSDIRKLREELGYTHEHEWTTDEYTDFLYSVEIDLRKVMRKMGERFLHDLLIDSHYYDKKPDAKRES